MGNIEYVHCPGGPTGLNGSIIGASSVSGAGVGGVALFPTWEIDIPSTRCPSQYTPVMPV